MISRGLGDELRRECRCASVSRAWRWRWSDSQLASVDDAERVPPALDGPSRHVGLHESFGRPLHDEWCDQRIPPRGRHWHPANAMLPTAPVCFQQQLRERPCVASGVVEQAVAEQLQRAGIPRRIFAHEFAECVTHAHTRIDERRSHHGAPVPARAPVHEPSHIIVPTCCRPGPRPSRTTARCPSAGWPTSQPGSAPRIRSA